MSMGYIATVHLESVSPFSSSKIHDTPKSAKESYDAYEKRTWREKAHFTQDGYVEIPAMAFKFALMDAAAYLGERVPEKGMKTWTQYFISAVLIESGIVLPLLKKDLESVTLSCHANGSRKSGKRVRRTFPYIKSWKGDLVVQVFDETITREIFARVFAHAGTFIGIGRFRPQNGGFNGRFHVVKIDWKKMAEAA